MAKFGHRQAQDELHNANWVPFGVFVIKMTKILTEIGELERIIIKTSYLDTENISSRGPGFTRKVKIENESQIVKDSSETLNIGIMSALGIYC